MSIPDDTPDLNPSGFDPDFASAASWAGMYRALLWQVVPAYSPGETKGTYKRPMVEWAKLQDALVPDFTFERWYGTGGEHRDRRNMGFLTGRCSGNVFVIDLDTHTHPEARDWWEALLAKHTGGEGITTVVQKTGGGGIQMLFRAPVGWLVPTNKTSIGVDIRGQGGFAMLPPCIHEKGEYQWLNPPWDTPVADAPGWLIEAVMEVVAAFGGASMGGRARGERPEASGSAYNDWGRQTDLREDKMFRMVFVVVVKWYKELNGVKPFPYDWDAKSDAEYAVYEAIVEPTISVPGKTKTELLEMQDRGPTEWRAKFKRCMDQWDDKIAEEAGKPSPKDEPPEQPKVDPKTGQPLPLVLTAKQFADGFQPPAYLIDGILQRGYLWALTARTNHGKTAVAMYIAQCVARSQDMHSHPVKGGTVLVLVGENPQDVRARFLVLAETYGFNHETIKMRFIDGVVDLAAKMPTIKAETDLIDDLKLVIVDTAAAYFSGDDSNSNSQQGAYARLLRKLTMLKGLPAVLVNCHPVKNAARDNLLPLGGSAFLNEIDGNLTLWEEADKKVQLHWQGKFRGPDFEPIDFELRVAQCDKVHDEDGRLLPSIVAVPLARMALEAGSNMLEADENSVLIALYDERDASQDRLATKCGFVIDGRPSRTKVHRILKTLSDYKFIAKHRRGKYRLTAKGRAEIGHADDDE